MKQNLKKSLYSIVGRVFNGSGIATSDEFIINEKENDWQVNQRVTPISLKNQPYTYYDSHSSNYDIIYDGRDIAQTNLKKCMQNWTIDHKGHFIISWQVKDSSSSKYFMKGKIFNVNGYSCTNSTTLDLMPYYINNPSKFYENKNGDIVDLYKYNNIFFVGWQTDMWNSSEFIDQIRGAAFLYDVKQNIITRISTRSLKDVTQKEMLILNKNTNIYAHYPRVETIHEGQTLVTK